VQGAGELLVAVMEIILRAVVHHSWAWPESFGFALAAASTSLRAKLLALSKALVSASPYVG
jgi:hypothetical protein